MKQKHTIEAYGVKGVKSTQWRKSFKDADALNKWAAANDAEVYGTRVLEVINPLNPDPLHHNSLNLS